MEGAAGEHQHEDQICGVHKAVDDIVHDAQRIDRSILHKVEAVWINQLPAGNWVLDLYILSRRHDPGKQDGSQDDDEDDDQGMRHFEFFLFGEFLRLSHLWFLLYDLIRCSASLPTLSFWPARRQVQPKCQFRLEQELLAGFSEIEYNKWEKESEIDFSLRGNKKNL